MKVNIGTMEFDDQLRRSIRHHFNQAGKATREECRSFVLMLVDADLETVQRDYDHRRCPDQASCSGGEDCKA